VTVAGEDIDLYVLGGHNKKGGAETMLSEKSIGRDLRINETIARRERSWKG